jgi:hypothetical protein
LALTWGAIMLAVTFEILFKPDIVNNTIVALGQVSMLWGNGLAVLGVNVYKRSDDKALVYGKQQEGILSAVASRIRGTPGQ